jgi:hypothetical protein
VGISARDICCVDAWNYMARGGEDAEDAHGGGEQQRVRGFEAGGRSQDRCGNYEVPRAGNGGGQIRGKLLEKRDETHYARTANPAEVSWGKQTALVMGKAEDIRAGAILHVTGTISTDRSVRARQIVILTGYVQVK